MSAATPDLATPRPRRMLVVVHGYPPLQTNGAEWQTYTKVRWWRDHGHEVMVLAADPQPGDAFPFDRIEERDDTNDGYLVRRVRFAVPDATRPFAETFQHPGLAAVVARQIAEFQPDIVYQTSGYLWGLAPLTLAHRSGIATALLAVDFWHRCPRLTLLRPDSTCCPGPRTAADCAACRLADRAPIRRLPPAAQRAAWQFMAAAGKNTLLGRALGVPALRERQIAVQECIGQIDVVIANSHFLATQLRQVGFADEQLLVMRQGMPRRAIPPRAPCRAATDDLRVLYLGQIAYHKGVDLLVESVARLRAAGKAITLRLHGPPTGDSAFLQRLRARCDDSQIILGPILDPAGVAQALAAADVLVVPSRWYENSPQVILEAFAAGIPVLTADHGGMAEMVRDGVDGLLFAPGNAPALEATLRRLLDEPALLTHLRAGIVPHYDTAIEMAPEDARLAALLHQRAR